MAGEYERAKDFQKRGKINHIQLLFLAVFVMMLKEISNAFPNDNKHSVHNS